MAKTMKAAVFTEKEKVEVMELPVPTPGPPGINSPTRMCLVYYGAKSFQGYNKPSSPLLLGT